MSDEVNKPQSELTDSWQQLIDSGYRLQQSMFEQWARWWSPAASQEPIVDQLSEACEMLAKGITRDPVGLVNQQLALLQEQLRLGEYAMRRLLGENAKPVIYPSPRDWRFKDDDWEANLLFDTIKQSYLLSAKSLSDFVDTLPDLDPDHRLRLQYLVRQVISAMAPSNFPTTNPEVLRKTLESKGDNLVTGFKQLLEDQQASGDNLLNICMSEPGAFTLGDDIANTPGQVVYQNRLFQLIQYSPTTEYVSQTPVLMIPSWVNKYYILDLSAKNSFVRWAVAEGLTVFMISWVNPDGSYRDVGFDNYMQDGVLTAVQQIQELTGENEINAVGYCLGGILLSITMAYLAKQDRQPIRSATYLTASMDFTDPGELKMFIDEESLCGIERMMSVKGYMDGRMMSAGFNLLKENDLYWNYFVQNYLKGERPSRFDLLHWNSDNTHIPARTHSFVMRELHLRNALMQANGISINGVGIDLGAIQSPVYFLSTEKDHIAKWQSTYLGTHLHGGPVKFVLAGSGHIAGVVNPPAANKYYYYSNAQLPQKAEDWLDGAFKLEGSWWPDWLAWLRPLSGEQVLARKIDPARVIEAAPGSYVQRRVIDIDTLEGAGQTV